MVTAAQELARSEALTAFLAVLNVIQTLWLADIAARARRVRRADRPGRHRADPDDTADSSRPPTAG